MVIRERRGEIHLITSYGLSQEPAAHLSLGRLNTEKHKHRKCQTQDPAFAFGCVAFGCVWIHSAFAAFAFGCVLRLGVLRLPAFGSGSAFAAFSTSAFGPRVHHSAFGMILRLRLAAFAFGCVCVWLRLGHPAFGCVWRSQHSPGRIASWLAIWVCGAGIHSARQPDSQGEN